MLLVYPCVHYGILILTRALGACPTPPGGGHKSWGFIMFITFSDCHCESSSSVESQHFTLIRVNRSDSKGSAVTQHSAAERERDVDRSDLFSSKFIGRVI